MQVYHFDLTVLSFDDFRDHLHGTRAKKRIQGDEVFKALGSQPSQLRLHPAAFKLEYPVGSSISEQRKDLRVVQRYFLQVDAGPFLLLDPLDRLVQHRKRSQGENVHLEETDCLQVFHAVLGRDFVLVGLMQRDEFHEGPRRDHHAGSMGGSMAGQAFQPLRDLNETSGLRVL